MRSNRLELIKRIAQATVSDGNGKVALRVEDNGGSGDIPEGILSAIRNANTIEDALLPFFSEDANGNMALKIAIDISAST